MREKSFLFASCLLAFGVFFASRAAYALEMHYPFFPPFNTLTQNTSTLPELFQFLFGFALWTAGIMLLGSILYVGFQYVASSANPQKRGGALRRFAGVVLGGAVLFGVFIILQTINPELINLRNLSFGICDGPGLPNCPKIIAPTINGGGGVTGGTAGGPTGGITGGTAGSPAGFKYFCQGDGQWIDSHYDGGSIPTMGQEGCGPTSLAMILDTFGSLCSGGECTPPVVAQEVGSGAFGGIAEGPVILSNGTALAGTVFTGTPRIPGALTLALPVSSGQPDLNIMGSKLNANPGALILAQSSSFPCAKGSCSHIFVIDAVNATSRTVEVRDPQDCQYGVSGSAEAGGPRILAASSFSWGFAYLIKPSP